MILMKVRPCVNEMMPDCAKMFFLSYFPRRKAEFEAVVVKPKKAISSLKRKKKIEKIELTPEEWAILKKLGL